jgi:hypothetical protein
VHAVLTPHAWEHSADRTQGAEDVRLKQRPCYGVVGVLDWAVGRDAAVVDEHVDVAGLVQHGGDGLLHRALVVHVEREDGEREDLRRRGVPERPCAVEVAHGRVDLIAPPGKWRAVARPMPELVPVMTVTAMISVRLSD